jgi:hypothetical protein
MVGGIILSLTAKAQYSTQYPLLLGQYGLNGTANYISRAGALGAVGGDITTASFNPAGLGLYRSSEIIFGSGLNIINSTLNNEQDKFNDDRHNYNFGNFGMVLNLKSNSDIFKSWQFGFAFNQLQNFSNRWNITRQSIPTSYITTIMPDIYDDNDIFCQSGVVWFDTSVGDYISNFTSGDFDQHKITETYGYQTSMDFTLSTNIADFVFVGVSVGVPLLSYTSNETFLEQRYALELSGNYKSTDEYIFNKITELNGSGVNLKVGAIVKPVDWLRLGVAIHTPTYYSITDSYYASVENFDYGNDYYGYSHGRADDLEYAIRTPFRFLGSLAFVLGNNESKVKGTLSADYEYANYSSMKYDIYDSQIAATNVNNEISSLYQPVHTFRFGGELKTGLLALRAGFAMIGNPYSKDANNDASRKYITGGLGFRGKVISFDLAYAYTLFADANVHRLYSTDTFGPATLSQNQHLVQATIGLRF